MAAVNFAVEVGEFNLAIETAEAEEAYLKAQSPVAAISLYKRRVRLS